MCEVLPYRIGINAPYEFFDLLQPTEIESGFKVVIKVWPTVISMDSELETGLTIDERRCRFTKEVPKNMTMFNKYSTSACTFDCMLKYR